MERVRYFPRQLITPDDLTQEQAYFRMKLRRQNRMLHGWGEVCGCEVKTTHTDWTVCVEPGYVLGPQGDEILIDRAVSVDISRQGLDGNAASSCADEIDPWCSNVRVDRRAGDRLYIAVAYLECPSRPVRVQPAGCGCDGGQCEYSRIRDGFMIRVLDHLPTSNTHMEPPAGPWACPPTGVRQCPDCIDEPWVVLASIAVKGKQIADQDIDNRTYRRYVPSLGDWWFTCAPAPTPTPTPSPTPTPIPIAMLKVGGVRLLRQASPTAGEVVRYEMANPAVTPDIERGEGLPPGPDTIEVRFQGAPLEFGSVINGQTFVVTNPQGIFQAGQITPMPNNTIRWFNNDLRDGTYRVRLVGTGPATIRSQQNVPLDGEPLGLPSGNNTGGGDFGFSFTLSTIIG
jgi:hypothetical protein